MADLGVTEMCGFGSLSPLRDRRMACGKKNWVSKRKRNKIKGSMEILGKSLEGINTKQTRKRGVWAGKKRGNWSSARGEKRRTTEKHRPSWCRAVAGWRKHAKKRPDTNDRRIGIRE